jgi:hypothetical protein
MRESICSEVAGASFPGGQAERTTGRIGINVAVILVGLEVVSARTGCQHACFGRDEVVNEEVQVHLDRPCSVGLGPGKSTIVNDYERLSVATQAPDMIEQYSQTPDQDLLSGCGMGDPLHPVVRQQRH